MIEKIMKAVKSGNKKRGRNITVGTVVGFLLSCTVLMGAEDNYLWIRENSGEIEFNTQKTTNANGAGGNWNKIHPYSDENIWDADTKTYINNMILSSSEENGIDNNGYRDFDLSYGLRLSVDLSEFNFINNGVITGTGSTGDGYGIYKVGSGSITNLENSGLITGTGSTSNGYGIHNTGGSITNLENSGLITGIGSTRNDYAYGIYSAGSGSITNLVNNGLITGIGSTGDGHGIYNFGGSSITSLENSGLIIGTGHYRSGHGIYSKITNLENSGLIAGTGSTGYGIYNYSMSSKIGTLTNTGVIFGTTNAIINTDGTINSAYNYGILINGNSLKKVVDGLTVVTSNSPKINEISNHGLAFVADSGNYKNYDNSSSNFGAIYT
ncbi:autotransporter outer membrane beta-barrel domain-containing protein, partial [Fusobacterium sp. THCT1E2]